MESLPIEDVKAIIRILGGVAGMSEPISDRRRVLMQGISDLVEADIWLWIHSRHPPGDPYPTAFKVMDGGWRDEAERAAFITALHDPEINRAANTFLQDGRHITTLRQQFMPENDPVRGPLLKRWASTSGMRECIMSTYRLDPQTFSGMGFHRRAGRAPFTPRERCIVHLVTSQIDWLHRAETDVPANDDSLLDLTPRQREVLSYLLGGDSRKQIAHKIQLSEHTIADHMKEIYKHFHVSSRAELLTLFMSGGKH